MDFLEKIPNCIRWILFLPASLIAHFISYPLITILHRLTTDGYLEGMFADVAMLICANLFSAVAFIWVGAIVAPKKNFLISIMLGVFYSFMLCFTLFVKLMLGNNAGVSWLEMIITILTGIIAIVGVIHYFHQKEKDKGSFTQRYEEDYDALDTGMYDEITNE